MAVPNYFVNPLYLPTGIEEYPDHLASTCFLVRRKKSYYLITAGHCIREGEENNYSCLSYSEDQSLFQMDTWTRIKPTELTKEEFVNCADLMIYTIESGLTINSIRQMVPISLDDFVENGNFNKGDTLFLRGNPKIGATCSDPERERNVIQMYNYWAEYREEVSPHFHQLQIDERFRLEDYNWLSGSPVFLYKNRSRKFAGMLLRASGSEGFGHFTSASFIVFCLDKLQSTPVGCLIRI